MGGQACVLYGGAEFSRDTDILLLAEPGNLQRLNEALALLDAEPIALPPLGLEYLLRGHAVHFRCHHPEAEGIRLDVMSVLRGVADFGELWERRTTIEFEGELESVRRALRDEEEHIRAEDRAYWAPLLGELERLRHERPEA